MERDHPCHGVVGGEGQLVLVRHSGKVHTDWRELVAVAGDRLRTAIHWLRSHSSRGAFGEEVGASLAFGEAVSRSGKWDQRGRRVSG